jgi:small redox-active disulfide protein 2
MKQVHVLGIGCPKCLRTAKNAKAAAQSLALEIDLVKVAEIAEIAKFGVMSTPALVVDGRAKVAGRVPTVDEIKTWFAE